MTNYESIHATVSGCQRENGDSEPGEIGLSC